MWRVEKEFRFEASHQLPHHDGKCHRLHGHSFRGRAVCEGNELETSGPKQGMLVDYSVMSAALQPIIEECLDHWHLNESLGLESPTSELIAKWIYDMLKPSMPALAAVVIEETCTSRAEYRPQAADKTEQ